MDEREQSLRQMTEEYPDSPLPWFSLGKHLAEVRRFAESLAAFERCLGLDPAYAAALMSLGDARAALGEDAAARSAWERCEKAALEQGHPSLAEEARERIEEL